jgi:hypothetical protein
MKALLMFATAASLALSLGACTTAHDVADDTEHVVRKTGHVAGHAVEKTGSAVAHGGRKLEEHTR